MSALDNNNLPQKTADANNLSPLSSSPHWLDKYLGTLWRHRDFRVLWISLTITHFGGQITHLALPLTAATLLHASPLEMGILTAMAARRSFA
jgi:hypothetical protein